MAALTEFSRPRAIHQSDRSRVHKRRIGLLVSDRCSVPNAGAIGEAFRLADEFEQAGGGQAPYRLSDPYVRDQHAGNSTIELNDLKQAPMPIFWFKDVPVAESSRSATPADMARAQIDRDFSADAARGIAGALQPHAIKRRKLDVESINAGTTTEKIHESARQIKENYGNPISFAQAAESAAMSKRNYLRCFRCELGMTPFEYLTRTRLESVCTSLMRTTCPSIRSQHDAA